MLMRWFIRVVASVVGLCALLGVGFLVKKYALHDPKREMFREGIAASAAIRKELGHETHLRVDPAPGDDEHVVVSVQFPDPPEEPAVRRDLVRSVNILVRRHVHHVKHVKVSFDDTPDELPSWDGGVAVAGTPVPIGVAIPPAIPTSGNLPPPARIGVAPVAAPDAGAPPQPKPARSTKTGTFTLVTFPEADVFRGKERLGKTPLFNAELPVGTHLLTLVGADGLKRRLSMPVKVGKNKPLKVNLDDLPAK